MPIYGLHLAVSVLVGERLGENRDDLAARATHTTLHMAWLYMLAISAMYVFTPIVFLRGFYTDLTALDADQAAVMRMAGLLLQFVAAYNLFDATLMVFVGALKGAGDTQFILRVSIVLAAMLAGFSWLAVEVWRLNVYGCWVLVCLWVWIASATYFLRFRQGKWRRMRVIETISAELGAPIAVAE
jgi:MATE family multidrug resistance protein